MWSVRNSIFQVCAASNMIQLTCCQLGDHFKAKLTRCIDDMGVIESKFHPPKQSARNKAVQILSIKSKHWITLPSVLMMCELWEIQKFRYVHHQNWTLKQNLPPILIKCELLIHIFTKESEGREINNFTSCQLISNTKVN